MQTGERTKKSKRSVVLAGVLVLAVIAAAAWWVQSRSTDDLSIPKRVCNDTFDGEKVKPLLEDAGGKLNSRETHGFPGSFGGTRVSQPVCELSADGGNVSFRVEHPTYGEETPGNVIEDPGEQRLVKLGDAFGVHRKRNGVIALYIPCPTRKIPEADLFLVVGTGAASGEADKETKKLADLTGYAARTLAQRVYKCKGADGLPGGPVEMKPEMK